MNYRNKEGYSSPTEYHALNRIQKEERKSRYRPMVYVLTDFSHDSRAESMALAKKCCRFAKDNHAIPVSRHLLFADVLDEPLERKASVLYAKAVMGKCDEVWCFGKTYTLDMQHELKWARSKGKTIRFITDF